MNNTNKTIYEEPKLQVIAFCSQDIIANSTDPFFGEEDPLVEPEASSNNVTW